MNEPPKPDYARNMRIVGHSDQGGRPDAVQVMVHRGFAYGRANVFQKDFPYRCAGHRKKPRAG
jgi:hypothetical protein